MENAAQGDQRIITRVMRARHWERNKRSREEIDFESRVCREVEGMGGIDLEDIYKFMKEMKV